MMNIQHTLAKMFSRLTTRLVIIFSLFIISVIVIIQGIQLYGIPFTAVNGRLEEQRQEVFKNIGFIADLKKNQLLRWMEEVRGDVHIAANNYFIVSEVVLLKETTYELAGNNLSHAELLLQPGYKNHYEALYDYFSTIISAHGRYNNIHIADPETGEIFFSVDSSYVGVDISEENYFKGTIETLNPYTSDVLLLQQGASPVIYFAVLIKNQDGEVIAVLIAEAEIDKIIQSMLLTGEAMGASGETVLVNQDSKILAPLKYPLPDGSEAIPLSFRIETLPATLAAAGIDGIIESDDYRGIPVLAAFRHIRVAVDLGWGMVVKIDQSEIFVSLQRELLRTSLIGLGSMVTAIILTIFIARRITGPIRSISDAAEEIAKGNLDIQVPVVGSYETITAAKAFNVMVKKIKDAQEKIIRQERLATLGQFSGSISHELRNPLGVIDSSAYYLKIKLKDADKKTLEHLDRIKSGVDTSTTIIDSLLSLTRMKEPLLGGHDLVAITHDTIVTFKVPATVNVITNFPEEEIMVSADQEQLRIAFQNIIKNAVGAMDDTGTLTVTIQTTADGQAEVSFADTGTGITPENLDKIFQPLFSTKARGIGFGLSIAKMVIDKHGGTIKALSKLGKGAIIIIRLPTYTFKDKEV